MPDVGRKNRNTTGKTRNLAESHGRHPNGMWMCRMFTEHPMGNMGRVWKPDDVLDMLKSVVLVGLVGKVGGVGTEIGEIDDRLGYQSDGNGCGD